MSLILDALKKLERDKITRRKRTVHIASDILLTGGPAVRRKTLILTAGLAGAAVAALVLTIVIVNPFEVRTPVRESATVSPPSDPRAASMPAPEAAVPQKRTRTAAVHDDEADEETARFATVSKRKAAVSKPMEKAGALKPEELPILAVSGIAWMEDPRSRRVMVNGEIIGEGGKIGRTWVVEIHPDHVLFSHEGRTFSVYMK